MHGLNKKFLIHFEITQTKEIELLREYFFKLIILRKFDLNEEVKYFERKVEILIEISNDFMDYINEIPIFLKLKILRIDKINKINLSPEINLVAKILTMYESGNILKKQSEIDKIKIQLSKEECQNIILKYL